MGMRIIIICLALFFCALSCGTGGTVVGDSGSACQDTSQCNSGGPDADANQDQAECVQCDENVTGNENGDGVNNDGPPDEPDADEPDVPLPPPPTVEDNFAGADSLWDRQIRTPVGGPERLIRFARPDASTSDGMTVRIGIDGNPALGPGDFHGPTHANQISTDARLHFGTYRISAKAASCLAGEEVITGIFVYSNDGSDLNGNGLIDNNEIDIEIACTIPHVLWLTTWTDYQGDGVDEFKKVTRRIDMLTGNVRQTRAGMEGHWGGYEDLGAPIEGLPVAGFSAVNDYYEMGFEWDTNQIRFFIVINGREIALWRYTGSVIPQNPVHFMFNLWHSRAGWNDDADKDFPSRDVFLDADRFRYWAQ